MSLQIDINKVEQVLLTDTWHHVAPRSFKMDAWEFKQGGRRLAVTMEHGTAVLTGATWQEGTLTVACPVSAILALKWAGSGARKSSE